MNLWKSHVPILGYHKIGCYKSDHVPTVSAEAFEQQLHLLVKLGFNVISLNELAGMLEAEERIPKKCAAITFDDGYEETHSLVWPLLRKFGFPACVFITPNEVGRKGFMSWDQVAEVGAHGMTIGSHTMSHAYLPLVKESRLQEEVMTSKKIIEERSGQTVEFLSYPVGGFTPLVQVIARQAGYRGACTTNRAWRGRGMDSFALRRIKVSERDKNPVLFWAKVSGYYDLFRRLKNPG